MEQWVSSGNTRLNFRDTRQGTRSSWFGHGDQGPQKQKLVNGMKPRPFWLLQGSPQNKVLSHGSSDEVVVWLVPRDEWPDHRFSGVLVAFGRPEENGGSGLHGCLTPGAGVVQEEGKLLYRCQNPNRSWKSQGPRYLDLTPVVFVAEDEKRTHQRSLCWRANNGGVSSVRNFRAEQAQRRNKGGLEIQPSGFCWIETVMRRKYMGVTKDLRRGTSYVIDRYQLSTVRGAQRERPAFAQRDTRRTVRSTSVGLRVSSA